MRVSTLKQVGRDDDPDGYSLPAQREACERKAASLDAEVVAVFVDRGESAKTADRKEFQKMIAFVKQQGDIDYVILDKVDRFARNRRDDANIMFELKSVGATLVSVKENIDETPGGQLLHAIMAGIVEFYSRNLATEALKGITQKAKVGGTPGRAPVGYLNTRQRIEGREVTIVIIDPERAPHVRWAFEMYATGEWTLRQLTDALAERGLMALPHGKKLPGPLAISHVSRVLNNRYYIGKVTFKGIEYEGRHEPLISEALFIRVQEMLALHNVAGEKPRVHTHYLKSAVYCGACGERLSLMNAKGQYLYFYCLGRQNHRTDCAAPYMLADAVEEAVERYWKTVRISEEVQDAIREGVRAEIQHQQAQAAPEVARAKRRVGELADERRRLARGVVTGSVPEDLAQEEQARVATELRQAESTLRTAATMYDDIEETLRLTLELVGRASEVY
ncbi:recombinase family protein [Frankia sp. CcWB3]